MNKFVMMYATFGPLAVGRVLESFAQARGDMHSALYTLHLYGNVANLVK